MQGMYKMNKTVIYGNVKEMNKIPCYVISCLRLYSDHVMPMFNYQELIYGTL